MQETCAWPVVDSRYGCGEEKWVFRCSLGALFVGKGLSKVA